MSIKSEIKSAFAAKNWQVEDYDYDRNDGYAISINTEEYPEADAMGHPAPAILTDAQESLIAAYAKAFDDVEAQIMKQSNDCTCDGGMILAGCKERVLLVAELIPDRLTISA